MKYFICALLLAALSNSSRAQLVFDATEVATTRASDQTTYVDSTALSGLVPLVSLAGANQTWDFSNQPFVKAASNGSATQTVFDYPGSAALANDPDFSTSTHVVKNVPKDPNQPITYTFLRFDPTGSWLLGITQDSMGVKSKRFSYTPPYQEYKFPLTYQTAWASTSNFNSPAFPPDLVETISDDDIVDGYGTLITPDKSSVECLRVKNKITYQIIYMGNPVSSSSVYTFSWITKSFKSMVVTTDGSQNPVAATYATGSGSDAVHDIFSASNNPLNINISNNPIRKETQISFNIKSAGNVQIALMDALGNETRMIHNGYLDAGRNTLSIDATSLPSGIFFLHINADGIVASRKVIIVK